MTEQIAKNTLYLTCASIGQKILAFFYYLFLARIMMPEDTGIYFLALSFILIFGVVADFGITSVLIREIAKDPTRAKEFIQSALGYKIPWLGIAFVGTILAALFLPYDPLTRFLIFTASLIMIADTFSLFFYGILRGFQNIHFESFGIFFGQLISVLLGAMVLFFYPSLPLLITAVLTGSLFNTCFSFFQVRKRLGMGVLKPLWKREEIKELFLTALPFALAAIFVKVYSYIDSIFLSFYLGTEAVGIYSVAYKFTYAFQFIPLAFVATLYPGMSALVKKDRKILTALFHHALWYMMIIVTPIVFGLWSIAPDVIRLTGPAYEEAIPLLQMLIFVLLPLFLDFPIGSLLNAMGRQSTKTVIMGITMLINIILNIICIPLFGIMGAVYAALGSFFSLFFLGIFFVARILPEYAWISFIKMAFPIFISGVVMAWVTIFLRPLIGFVFVIPVAALIYLFFLFLFGAVKKKDLKQARSFLRHGVINASVSPDISKDISV